ncbi:unnamed protein product [Cyclocybe aegerita]|uniref:Uncharacterized protein n=1 Tax=Cyclocybe aegerita TaxID=1973307 RepID=A0A8S0X4K6_CYCAE|nr:unnamed protein product [Cyclocybe aegerita]
MHDNDPEVLEREKHKNLTGKQGKSAPHDHAPGWNETLATASEADVKADKSTGSPAELQASTVELLRARRSEIEGEDGTGSTTAFYARDEVSGPLSSVQGKEEVTITKRRIHQEDGSTDIVEEIEDVQRMTPSEEDARLPDR